MVGPERLHITIAIGCPERLRHDCRYLFGGMLLNVSEDAYRGIHHALNGVRVLLDEFSSRIDTSSWPGPAQDIMGAFIGPGVRQRPRNSVSFQLRRDRTSRNTRP